MKKLLVWFSVALVYVCAYHAYDVINTVLWVVHKLKILFDKM